MPKPSGVWTQLVAVYSEVRSRNFFNDRIVQQRPNLPDGLVLARRVYAVGQEDDVEISFPVDPQRRAGEAGVANRGGGEARAAGGGGEHPVPSERARAAG